MRTVTMLFVITSLLLCGFIAAAQQEAAPGAPTDSSVEGGPGVETGGVVEGAPGAETAPVDGPREGDRLPDGRIVGTPGGERPVTRGDLSTPTPASAVVERRNVVVRQLAAATRRGDQVAVKRLTNELGKINERLALVEANPLGGEEGQRRLWQDVLLPAGIRSESYLREHYGLEPVSAPELETESMPATPAKGGAPMPLALQIILGAVAVGAAVMAIIALAGRGNAVDVIDALLADDRAAGERRVVSGRVGNARFKQTTEPANPTPVIPPAPAAAPAQPTFPAAPLGVAYVPVQVTANPVTLNPAAPVPPAPAPAPAAPAPQAQQPVNVYFNNNQGQQPQQARPQGGGQGGNPPTPAPQPQPRPRPQPRNQGPAPAPAPAQGNPPAAPAAPAPAPAGNP